MTQAEMSDHPTNIPKHVDFDIKDLPTLSELERNLRAARPGKAMGLDLIPPELLHHASHRLAKVVWPLFAKQNLTVSECLQHKGGASFQRTNARAMFNSARTIELSSFQAVLEKLSTEPSVQGRCLLCIGQPARCN